MRKGEMGRLLRYGAVITAAILSLVGAEPSSAQQAAPSAAVRTARTAMGEPPPRRSSTSSLSSAKTAASIMSSPPMCPRPAKRCGTFFRKGSSSRRLARPNYSKAKQSSGSNFHQYQLRRTRPPMRRCRSPRPAARSRPTAVNCSTSTKPIATRPPIVAAVASSKTASRTGYYKYLLTGGNPHGSNPDPRIWYDGQGASSLPPAVYQLTNTTHSPFLPYDLYAASPVHRLFQMWQDLDCSAKRATPANPSGCLNDFFAWVENTVGAGSNGAAPPSGGYTGEGSTSPQFFNVQAGDAPYLKMLADTYTMSDNYHQGVHRRHRRQPRHARQRRCGFFSDLAHKPAVPPNNPVDPTMPGTPLPGFKSALSEVENPDPQPGTNNFYNQDGYGGGSGTRPRRRRTRTTAAVLTSTATNASQGGVSAVSNYLSA